MKKYLSAAAAGKRFWIIFLSVDSLVWIFAIGGTRVDPLHNGPLMCCRDTGGGGRQKSPIFIPGPGLIIKNIPQTYRNPLLSYYRAYFTSIEMNGN